MKKNDNKYIKIIEIKPINFSLKSEIEKMSILNSYKILLKTCNFDIQIIIKNNKLNIEDYISNINKSENILNQKYINFIKSKISKLINKSFYIIIKEENINNETEEIVIKKINQKYLKIKECLTRCGNNLSEINNYIDVINLLNTFFNYREEKT